MFYFASLFFFGGFLLSFINGQGFDFIAMGDWGGQPSTPYSTPDEIDTADIMNEIATQYSSSFVLAIGDNFYDDGVINVNDPRFQETFESVFDGSQLLKTPFYVVAGNHDWNGNVSAQIDYTKKSTRWKFSNYFYSEIFNIPQYDTTLQIVMIDTVILAGNTQDKDYCLKHNIPLSKCQLHPNGFNNPKLSSDEWQWINETLSSSKADYLIVAGHYPIWSIGEHGPTAILVDKLRPMLKANNVQLYLNGHDHSFQYILDANYSNCGYIVTGGAHVCDSSQAHINDIPANSLKYWGCNDGGFVRVHIDDKMIVSYYGGDNNKIIYQTNSWTPRNKN